MVTHIEGSAEDCNARATVGPPARKLFSRRHGTFGPRPRSTNDLNGMKSMIKPCMMSFSGAHQTHELLSRPVAPADGVLVVATRKTKNRPGGRHHRSVSEQNPDQKSNPDAANDAAFDRWLQEKLDILYGPVVDEPIPDEWLKIIEKFDKKNVK